MPNRDGIETPSPLTGRILDRQTWDSLEPFLGASPDPAGAKARLRRFGELVLDWNRGISNLISRNDEGRIVDRHMRESLEVADWLAESGARRWLDLGSGAGFPGIPLSIAGIGESWTLVESRRMKTLFMAKALQEIGLKGIEVVRSRLELILTEDRRGAFDGFSSRATMAVSPTLVLASFFVSPGGCAFLWKGSRREEEMDLDPAWKDTWEYTGVRNIGSGQNSVAKFIRRS